MAHGDGEAPGRWVAVWDPFVRIFHWSTVVLVVVAFFSDDARSLHESVGYAALALVLLRLVWGIVGTRRARFADFVAGPTAILDYLRGLISGRAPRYMGHNPAGGAMILALLLLLVVTAGTGWLSETDTFFGVAWVSHLHHWAAHLMLALIALHVIGVIVSSWMHGENLVLAMLNGRKRAELGAADD